MHIIDFPFLRLLYHVINRKVECWKKFVWSKLQDLFFGRGKEGLVLPQRYKNKNQIISIGSQDSGLFPALKSVLQATNIFLDLIFCSFHFLKLCCVRRKC